MSLETTGEEQLGGKAGHVTGGWTLPSSLSKGLWHPYGRILVGCKVLHSNTAPNPLSAHPSPGQPSGWITEGANRTHVGRRPKPKLPGTPRSATQGSKPKGPFLPCASEVVLQEHDFELHPKTRPHARPCSAIL